MAEPVEQEPVILLVGAGPASKDELVQALARHGIHVEAVSTDLAQEAVVVAAPDLVVLADEAARDGGTAVLRQLGASPMSSVVPAVVLTESPSPEERQGALRRGAAAVLARSATMDTTAERLAELARQLPWRTSQTFDELGESLLNDFAHALCRELDSERPTPDEQEGCRDEVSLAFGGGRPLARLVDEFVQRLGQPVVHAEAVDQNLVQEGSPQGDRLGDALLGELSDPGSLVGLRVALVDDDVARADAAAQDLGVRGATVLVVDPAPSQERFDQLRQLDPSVLVMGDRQVRGEGRELIRRAHADLRLRWAALLVVDWEQISQGGPVRRLALDQLWGRVAAVAGAEPDLQRRLHEGFSFDTRLESTGPCRLLHALAEGLAPLRVTVRAPRARVELDLSEGQVVGATAHRSGVEGSLEGPAALATLLTLSSGRVRVAPAMQPAKANLAANLDRALDLADREIQGGQARPTSASSESTPPASIETVAQAPRQAEPAQRRAGPASLEVSQALGARIGAIGQPGANDSAAGKRESGQKIKAIGQPGANGSAAGKRESGQKIGAIGQPGANGSAAGKRESGQKIGATGQPETNRARASAGPGAHRSTTAAEPGSRSPRVDRRRLKAGVLAGAVVLGLSVSGVVALVALPGPAPTAPVSPEPVSARNGVHDQRPSEAPVKPAAAAEGAPGASGPSDTTGSPEQLALPAATNPTTPSCEQLVETDSARARPDTPAMSYVAMTHGRKALVRGDVREAQRAYCRAVRADPGNASAQAELARLLLIRRDAKAGLAQVRRALEIEPHSRVLQGLLGDALARLGQYDAARKAWLMEAQLDGAGDDSDEALAKIFLGTARQHRFRHAWGEAERFYRRVAVLEPSNVEASLGLAQALRGLKEPGEARAWAAYAAQLQSAPLEGAAVARDQGVGP